MWYNLEGMVEIFDDLKKIFNLNGYRLYMIGSTSRDYLFKNEIRDYDFVSNATPLQIKKFLDIELTFMKYGVSKYKYKGFNIDIATLRKEEDYFDYRHPKKIEFVNNIEEDYKRRDFTINAIYIDENYNIIDPSSGVTDLKNRTLRMIGDPEKRIKEDPLRILRAIRFKEEYDLSIEESLNDSIKNNYDLLTKLNKEKIKQEEIKLTKVKELKNA